MEGNFELQDKIDRFLLNQMTEEERNNFIIDMETNPELKESVSIQKQIIDEINERESFMAILEKAETSKIFDKEVNQEELLFLTFDKIVMKQLENKNEDLAEKSSTWQ